MMVEEVLKTYHKKIYNLAYRVLGNEADAEDAFQEVALILRDKLDSFRGESALYTWLYRITVNVCLKIKKENQVYHIPDTDTIPETASAYGIEAWEEQHNPVEQTLILNSIKEEIKQKCQFFLTFILTDEQRLVFLLREFFDLEYQEIADVLDIQLNTVKARLSRARTNLRTQFHKKCSYYNPENPCRCDSKIGYALTKYPEIMNKYKKEIERPEYESFVQEKIRETGKDSEKIFDKTPELSHKLNFI